MYQEVLQFETRPRGWLALNRDVEAVVARSGVEVGLCQLFLQHTSATLVITENADPDVRGDLERWMQRAVPDGDPLYAHDAEGDDDMPAHVRNAVVGCERSIPVGGGRLLLGTWQGLYLWEARTMPHRRRVVVTVLGGRRER